MNSCLRQQITHRPYYLVRLETELLLELFERCRGAKGVHPDDTALLADVALPPQSGAMLDRDTSFDVWWQHTVPILLRLVFEDVPGRHRDHASADAFRHQLVVSLHGQTDLAARRDQDYFRIPVWSISEYIGSARNAGCRSEPVPIQGWQGLTR